ncbi:MAG: 2-oxoacid:acceptor oxidoreductase subunit alpha [Bacteroidales bacterium]|nr:2-oxoacid:acceptor oxidoreductase subunit alpha [Bacteroidales bacterium]MDD7560015.1 2-oxoacid:acceptor oxidoreductase subunit alpha [Bacteroidales bacterium]
MGENHTSKAIDRVVIRFAGDSGDGMQLTGSLFSQVSAILGNEISTFPDYPAEVRAPRGSLGGVSGFQVQIGTEHVRTPGDLADVLVAMNPAALKVSKPAIKENAIIIIDDDSFTEKDLAKGMFTTDNPFLELGLEHVEVVPVPLTTMVKDSLKDSGLDVKEMDRSKNMFALGLILWLFEKDITPAEEQITKKFGKKEQILRANLKVLTDGYNYGHNTHLQVTTYRIDGQDQIDGRYAEINGNKATSLGLVAAAEAAGLELYLGSYPITPATDILHELSKMKAYGVKTVQAEDEIAGICSAIGASFAGDLAVTSTSGPGLALKSEGIGLAVMTELPLVVIDVMRSGPSTGMPTKAEQSDLFQALYGRNGESPIVVMAALTPTDCFDAAYQAAKIALEHMTPVILLTDAYIANGASVWRIPDLSDYPPIRPRYVSEYYRDTEKKWSPYFRDPKTLVRYWATPGTPGYMHRLGGLEKDGETGAISTNPVVHDRMVHLRDQKVKNVVNDIPDLVVEGNADSETLLVGWGSTYGHNQSALYELKKLDQKIALAQFKYINPLPKNTAEVLRKYKKIVVVEQNLGMFADYLTAKVPGITTHRINKIEGQPFKVSRIVKDVMDIINNL